MTALEVCVPEETMEKQLEHIGCEFEELVKALAIYRNDPTAKNRAEVLFEALDLMTCTKSFIVMEFTEDETTAGIDNINSKNYVRHYRLDQQGDE